MFIYCFIVSFLYCLVPSETTARLWLIAIILGVFIRYQNDQLTRKAKHRAD